jgi:hypothetical protein
MTAHTWCSRITRLSSGRHDVGHAVPRVTLARTDYADFVEHA